MRNRHSVVSAGTGTSFFWTASCGTRSSDDTRLSPRIPLTSSYCQRMAPTAWWPSQLACSSGRRLPFQDCHHFRGVLPDCLSYDLNRSLERIAKPRYDEFQLPAMASVSTTSSSRRTTSKGERGSSRTDSPNGIPGGGGPGRGNACPSFGSGSRPVKIWCRCARRCQIQKSGSCRAGWLPSLPHSGRVG